MEPVTLQASALRLLASLLVTVGLAGWSSAQVLHESVLENGLLLIVGGSTLATVMVGLLTGVWVIRHWRREVSAYRA